MTKTQFRLMVAGLVIVGATTQARASQLGFEYKWSFGEVVVSTTGEDTVTASVVGNVLKIEHANGTAQFQLIPSGVGEVNRMDGPSSISVGSLTSTGAMPTSAFTANFGLNLEVTDGDTGQSNTLTLSGAINSTPDSKAMLSATFDPIGQFMLAGYNVYHTSIPMADVVIPPERELPMPVLAEVRAHADGYNPGDPVPQAVPEPTSILLGASAMVMLAIRRASIRRA